MKSIIKNKATLALIFSIGAIANNASAENAANLTVNIGNIQSEMGQILISVCTKEQFMKSACSYSTRVSAQSAQEGPIVFKDIAQGVYAVQMFHDLDSDNKLKSGAFGIPKEPWGMSNDAKGKFGPPKFEDAAINVNGATEITINLDGGE